MKEVWNKRRIRPGDRFGIQTIIQEVGQAGGHRRVEVACDCGSIRVIDLSSLLHDKTKSCGCMKSRLCSEKKTTHNKSHTRIYRIWAKMKERCYNPKSKDYVNYGARGIMVCMEWMDFTAFYMWATMNGYNELLTIDRKDSDLGYSPNNCRWITRKEQNRNKRNSRVITVGKITQCIGAWAEDMGVGYNVAKRKLNRYAS